LVLTFRKFVINRACPGIVIDLTEFKLAI